MPTSDAAPTAAPVRLLVVQNDPTDPVALLGEWWAEVGVELVVVRADAGEQVPTALPDDVDGVVLLGGSMAAWEDQRAPWLPDERALARDVVAQDRPLLGVCLGGQLLALAAGGVVERAVEAEVGLLAVDLLADAAHDAVFSVLPATARVAQYHQDAVTSLPADAVLLASSDACRVQGFRLGARCWGLQFHPEVDADILGSWFDDDPEPVARAGRAREQVEADMRASADLLAATWRPFAHAFADVARASRADQAAG